MKYLQNEEKEIDHQTKQYKKQYLCCSFSFSICGTNINIIGCISHLSLMYYELRKGSFTNTKVDEFVKQFLRKRV